MPLEQALSIILAEMLAVRTKTRPPEAGVSLRDRMTTLDTFEIMIRVDDVAIANGLSGTSPRLERWSEVDCASLAARLQAEPRGYLLPVLLTLSPRGLARMAAYISFVRWMEVARAMNHFTEDQLHALRHLSGLEDYLCGESSQRPKLDVPMVFAWPLPSVLRVLQSTRFRVKLFRAEGHDEALRRYVRFFC